MGRGKALPCPGRSVASPLPSVWLFLGQIDCRRNLLRTSTARITSVQFVLFQNPITIQPKFVGMVRQPSPIVGCSSGNGWMERQPSLDTTSAIRLNTIISPINQSRPRGNIRVKMVGMPPVAGGNASREGGFWGKLRHFSIAFGSAVAAAGLMGSDTNLCSVLVFIIADPTTVGARRCC